MQLPLYVIRVTIQDVMSDMKKAALMKKFRRSIKRCRAGGEYWGVLEWSEGKLHFNLLVQARGKLTPAAVAHIWARACPGVNRTLYCRPVDDPVRIARYVVKDVSPTGKHGHKRELPPLDCKIRRLVTYSKHFFTAPPRELWNAQKEEWRKRKEAGQ